MARVRYGGGGDWYNDPDIIPNLAREVNRRTTLRMAEQEAVVDLTDPRLFSFPILFITGHGNIKFTEEEVKNLRRYLENGGFLYADDDHGMDEAFRREIRRVFPDAELVELPFSHADPDGAVCVAQLVNWAGKAVDNGFYWLKPAVFAAAAAVVEECGLDGDEGGYGWSPSDGCFMVAGPAREAWAHDPFGQLWEELHKRAKDWRVDPEKDAPWRWDGRVLQPFAPELAFGLPKARARALRRAHSQHRRYES